MQAKWNFQGQLQFKSKGKDLLVTEANVLPVTVAKTKVTSLKPEGASAVAISRQKYFMRQKNNFGTFPLQYRCHHCAKACEPIPNF